MQRCSQLKLLLNQLMKKRLMISQRRRKERRARLMMPPYQIRPQHSPKLLLLTKQDFPPLLAPFVKVSGPEPRVTVAGTLSMGMGVHQEYSETAIRIGGQAKLKERGQTAGTQRDLSTQRIQHHQSTRAQMSMTTSTLISLISGRTWAPISAP